MNVDNIPLLMAFFWQGFSLTFMIFIWYQRATFRREEHEKTASKSSLTPLPLLVHVTLSFAGFCGALGAAGLIGMFNIQVPETSIAFVIALFIGMWAGFMLNRNNLGQTTIISK
jgi:hypothetical protein